MTNNELKDCKEQLTKMGFNRFIIDQWEQLVSSSDFNIIEYDRIVYYFACNLQQYDGYANKTSSTSFLAIIESQIYSRIKNQRLMGNLDIYASIGINTLLQNITDATSVEQTVINMFITLIITEVTKIGIDAWCQHYESKQKNNKD